MKQIDQRWAASVLFLLTLLTLAQLSMAQGTNTPSPYPRPAPSSPQNETIASLVGENVQAAQDVFKAYQEFQKQGEKRFGQMRGLFNNFANNTIKLTDGQFPQLTELLIGAVKWIDDQKDILLAAGTLLAGIFQMVFGGGVSYLTSKMSNLSKHKIKIEQGFDLQYRMYQDQNKSQKKIQVSKSFKNLFTFLDYKDNKEMKLILGTSGVGFSANIKEWIRQLKEKDPSVKCLYYDMADPPLRTNSAQENTHMSCISDIVYSLLHAGDRNFVLKICKDSTEIVFDFLLKFWKWLQGNILLCILYVSSWWLLPQVFYLVTLIFLTQGLINPLILIVVKNIRNMIDVLYGVAVNKKPTKAQKPPKVKIVVDNFQVLRAEFEDYFKAVKLQKVKDGIRTAETPAYTSTTADTSTLKEHEQLFLQNLTALFNDATTLQEKNIGGSQTEIIVIVRNSEFYTRYLEKLRLKIANPFKIKKLSQLPAEDILFTIDQRVFKQVGISVKKGWIYPGFNSDKIKAIDLTRYLRLFHNSSKEIMKILRELQLDQRHIKTQPIAKIPVNKEQMRFKTKEEYIADVIRRSMHYVLAHAEHLDQLSSIQPKNNEAKIDTNDKKNGQKNGQTKNDVNDTGNKENDEYLRYVGLFLGCIHKKLIFFANRTEGTCSELEKDYDDLMELMNKPEGKALDMVSTMSPSHRQYLFEKRNNKFMLKNDARLLILKWDKLIAYIEGDNNWADSLEQDFLYYYAENLRTDSKQIALNRNDQQMKINKVDVNFLGKQRQKKRINNEEIKLKGRQIFAAIVDFLTEKEMISEHVCCSRSVALANFYLQQKTKEKLLYQRFEMQKGQLAKTIERMENQLRKEDQKAITKVGNFAEKTRQKFQSYIEHEARSYEEGMDWLSCYFPAASNCKIGDAVIERAGKYLLARTSNNYVLRPFINDLMIYWDYFYETRFEQSQLVTLVDEIMKDHMEEDGPPELGQVAGQKAALKGEYPKGQQVRNNLQSLLRAKTTIFTYWYYQRYEEQRAISRQLLSCTCEELASSVEKLQALDESLTRIKDQHNFNCWGFKDLKTILKDNYDNLKSLFQDKNPIKLQSQDPQILKKDDFKEVNRLLFEYERLLKLYHPDGLFKELNIKYRKALYTFIDGRRYSLSPAFRNFIILYYRIKQMSQIPPIQRRNVQAAGRNVQVQVLNIQELVQKLAEGTKSFNNLKKQQWILLFQKGEKVRSDFRTRLLVNNLIRDEKLKQSIRQNNQRIDKDMEKDIEEEYQKIDTSLKMKYINQLPKQKQENLLIELNKSRLQEKQNFKKELEKKCRIEKKAYQLNLTERNRVEKNKQKRTFDQYEALLFTDLKTQLAAFCFTYGFTS